MLTIKLFSPWHTKDLIYQDVCFSPSVNLNNADGALWEYFPSDELILEYGGVKAWYSWEPSWHSQYRTKLMKKVHRDLAVDEHLYYAHSDLSYRVPHITNCGGNHFYDDKQRELKAIAIVSNTGGRWRFIKQSFRLRNNFITNKLVDLFGRRSAWEKYSLFSFLGVSSCPDNYKGELTWDGGWMSEKQLQFMAQYKVAICLENYNDPFYFTEKFYNAVRAGCIPIYHAHPSVREGILKGAKWIDPADFDFNPERTLRKALNESLEDFQKQNREWLGKPEVKKTEFDGVWNKLAEIFQYKHSLIEK